MKLIKRISLALTLNFLFFVTMAHAELNGNCAEIVKDMETPVTKAMAVHNGMHKTLKSDQLIDRYNRHVNILVSNLDREVSKMERLLGKAEAGKCDQLVKKMRGRIVNAKNIYHAMMKSILLPTAKKSLREQNDQLKSELDSLMKIQ